MEFIAHNVANVIPRVGGCGLKYENAPYRVGMVWIKIATTENFLVVQKASLVWMVVNKLEKKYQNNY